MDSVFIILVTVFYVPFLNKHRVALHPFFHIIVNVDTIALIFITRQCIGTIHIDIFGLRFANRSATTYATYRDQEAYYPKQVPHLQAATNTNAMISAMDKTVTPKA